MKAMVFDIWNIKESRFRGWIDYSKTAFEFDCMAVLIDRRDRNADFWQDCTVTDLNGLWEVLK